MPKGGARPGTGPKPGSHTNRATILTRRKAAKIIESGLSPLDVMMANMRFWHREVGLLEDSLREHMAKESKERGEPPDPSLLRLTRTPVVDRFFEAKDRLQDVARETAPYIHPRVSPVADGVAGGVRDLTKLTDEELDALERISRKIAGSYGDPGGAAPAKG